MLRLEPRQAQPLQELAQARLEDSIAMDEIQKSRDELERVIEMNPIWPSPHNNLAIAYLRLGVQDKIAGRADQSDKNFVKALASAEKAISVAKAKYGRDYAGYAKAWANKAYVLWQMDRMADAAAAGMKVREIEPGYVLHPPYLAEMARAGHPIPPPVTK
jgi:tetratricopeptide (TPR) repeat protein